VGETMETQEHAEAAVHSGRRQTALLIAVLAAGLAFSEQGAQHADVRMSESAVSAADVWAEYQAKSTRANEVRDLAKIAAILPAVSQAAIDTLTAQLARDVQHFETDPKSGKTALAEHARELEAERDAARLKLQAFDNAAAALQLGIVLTTASVITGSLMLAGGGALLGLAGAVFAVLAMAAPAWGAL